MRMRLFFLFSLLLFFSSQHDIFAHQPYKPVVADPLLEPWRWKHILELRGKGIRCITESKDGVMWFGVDKGVYSYNGKNWILYSHENSVIAGPIKVLARTNDNRILAGSANALYEFKNNNWHTLIGSTNRLHINISCIKEISDGSILIGTGQGILIITDNQRTFISSANYLNSFKSQYPDLKLIELPKNVVFQNQSPRVDDIIEYNNGDIWTLFSQVNNGFIFQFNLAKVLADGFKTFKITTKVNKVRLGNKLRIIKTRNNKIWVISGHYNSGILSFDGRRWSSIKLSRIFGGDELHTSVMEDKAGSIWIGGLSKIFVYKNNRWSLYEAPQLPIPYSRIIFHESTRGVIWIAGMQNEVYYFDNSLKKWTTYKNLNFECESPQGNRWFLSADSRVILNNKNKWLSYSEKDSLIDSPVKIITTRSGQIWVAGSHKGVAATAYFDGKTWHKQLHPYLSWGIDYRAVFEAADGSVWFGASVDAQRDKGQQSGVLRLTIGKRNQLKWTHYTSAQGINQSNAYGIGQSKDGTIWLGGTQLLSFNGKRWAAAKGHENLNQFINCIYSSKDHNLWVGSRSYGLFSYNGNKWSQIDAETGLSSNSIISIYAVSDSSVWVSTDNGICRFDGKTWVNGVFHPRLNMTREGGSIEISKDGAIWINKSMREWKRRAFTFNTMPHTVRENFYTVRYCPDTLTPTSKIKVFAPKVDQSGNTVINWEGNDYWEDTPSDKLYYSFRLNGGSWSEFTDETYHTFTNLASGDYIFEVRARDFDFNIERNPVKTAFSVLPPVWKQSWFILLVLSFIAILSYAGYQIIKRNKELFKLNSSLNIANQELTQQKEEIIGQQQQIIEHQEQLEYSNNLLEKQNEEISSQRDKLEEMVHTIDDLSQARLSFFTNVSHEFRTPLTLILGPIEKLLTSKIKDKQEKRYLYNLIDKNAQRLLRLINQLLEFRKIEIGAIELSVRPGDIVKFLKDITNLFNNQASQRQIELTFQSSSKKIITAFDFDKIEKVIFNLLSNAFKFTPDHGMISVEVIQHNFKYDNINQKENSNNHHIQIIVKDSGVGIAEEHIPHVFERFYQVGEFQRFSSGSGLGLAYIKELIEIHGGKITVSSNPGEGTIFNVFIPLIIIEDDDMHFAISKGKTNFDIESADSKDSVIVSDKAKQGLSSLQKDHPKKKSETILIVEDDPDLMNYLGNSLSEYHIEMAANGLIGLNKALEIQPDLIISDIMMPEMDGLELCKQVKSNIITSHIPVILLTARSLTAQKVEGFEIGADDYVEKPFNDSLLLARIKNLIESRKKLRKRYLKDYKLEPEELEVASADEKLINDVMELIQKNLSESTFNIDEMCKQFYLSRSHFSRKIKQLTGLPPIELLTTFRLKQAAKIIVKDRISISEVAYMVGFEHPNSLSRAFKKEYGMSPSEYAEKHRN